MKIKYACGYDEKGNWYCLPENQAPRANKEALNVLFDDMPPTVHPCDQQVYTSKAKFRATTRAHGKIEVGNEHEAFMNLKPCADNRPRVSESIKNAWEFLETCQGKSEGERREIEARFYGNEG
jgi:hypothetical protein